MYIMFNHKQINRKVGLMTKHSIPYKHSKTKCSRSRSTRKDKPQYGGFVSIYKTKRPLNSLKGGLLKTHYSIHGITPLVI